VDVRELSEEKINIKKNLNLIDLGNKIYIIPPVFCYVLD
jgi:hypothetical protein